jgi:IclR family transcriptional regulator, acetate operon repressor
MERTQPGSSPEADTSSSYGKLFRVLEAIAVSDSCSLSDVVGRSGLPFSTVHRIAGELIDQGYVMRMKRGRYRLGPTALLLSRNTSMQGLLAEASRPFLADLARTCRTHVHLGVFEDDMVTYLANASFGRNEFHIREGMQLEAYCSGIGKILLAHLPEADREHYLSQGDFVPLTPNTIVDREALAAELDAVRKRGWATDLEEVEPDMRCIAVPVAGPDGRICAAISATFRNKGGSLEALLPLLPALNAAADGLSTQISNKKSATKSFAATKLK